MIDYCITFACERPNGCVLANVRRPCLNLTCMCAWVDGDVISCNAGDDHHLTLSKFLSRYVRFNHQFERFCFVCPEFLGNFLPPTLPWPEDVSEWRRCHWTRVTRLWTFYLCDDDDDVSMWCACVRVEAADSLIWIDWAIITFQASTKPVTVDSSMSVRVHVHLKGTREGKGEKWGKFSQAQGR